jgi:transcriptional regulator of acetoin/glycerol metabolism
VGALFGADERIPSKFLVDPIAAIPKIRDDWLKYQESGSLGDNIRPLIAHSWERAKEQRVSPERMAADVDRAALGGFEARDQARRLFLQVTRPIVNQLAAELSESDSAIVVCDESGRIIDRAGDATILRRTEAQNFVPDAVWNEECAGTNGIGLAIAIGRPAQVFAGEHFCLGFQGYACTAAPIRHPVTREVLGILDVTTDARAANFHTYAMVVHATRDIEQHMEEHVFGRERELLERYLRGRVGLQVPFLTVDRSGRTIIQNAQAAQTITNSDLPGVMHVVREALRKGSDVKTELDLNVGRAAVGVHVVREHEDVIGAVVVIEPATRKRRPAGTTIDQAWMPLTGQSPAMHELFRRATRVAVRRVSVIIEGEAGTGKLTLARALHARSASSDRPCTVVNCSARDWRRAWDRALSAPGTIILRRISSLADPLQLELAAQLEELEPRDEHWMMGVVTVGDPPPRLELVHRLGRTRLVVPPLRERPSDIELIVSNWCRNEARTDPPGPQISVQALEALVAYDWPGNVRQLLNTLASARIQQRGATITPHDLGLTEGSARRRAPSHSTGLRDVEREAIERALTQTGGNVSRAADILGISRSTLHRRLRSYRLVGR